jgi:hypothetical protein
MVCLPTVVFDRPGGQVSATVTDLSVLGCRVCAPWSGGLPPGGFAGFEAVFYTPGVPWPIVLPCSTIWTQESARALDIGAAFDGGDQESLLALQRYLASRAVAERAVL